MRLAALLAAVPLLYAQQSATQPNAAAGELLELGRGYSEANSSPVELLRFIDKYLAGHPQSAYRPKLEHDATLAAAALHDDAAIIRYGEASLALTPDDMKVLPPVTRALLASNDREQAARALKYARRAEDLARQAQKEVPANITPEEWRNQTERGLARAMTDDARATGILGQPDQALTIAQHARELYPDCDTAREVAYWLERLGKMMEAAEALAEAFTIPDPLATEDDRVRDRQHTAELYRRAKGPEDHLGDVVLAAYDRSRARLKARDERIREDEPNRGINDPLALTLSGLNGAKLALADERGKVVVMDIWATYCVPCRAQHPLYEQVKQRFLDNPAVVFLSINTDSERELVPGFVNGMQWKGPVYFEDGLVRIFSVNSLPSTIILDRRGKLYTHLNGYAAEHFVDLLTERIRDALAAGN